MYLEAVPYIDLLFLKMHRCLTKEIDWNVQTCYWHSTTIKAKKDLINDLGHEEERPNCPLFHENQWSWPFRNFDAGICVSLFIKKIGHFIAHLILILSWCIFSVRILWCFYFYFFFSKEDLMGKVLLCFNSSVMVSTVNWSWCSIEEGFVRENTTYSCTYMYEIYGTTKMQVGLMQSGGYALILV